MGKKLDNTRIVTFKEEYKPAGIVLYAKDSTHAIHKSVVELLEGKVKMDVKEFNEKAETEKAKKAFEDSKKVESK